MVTSRFLQVLSQSQAVFHSKPSSLVHDMICITVFFQHISIYFELDFVVNEEHIVGDNFLQEVERAHGFHGNGIKCIIGRVNENGIWDWTDNFRNMTHTPTHSPTPTHAHPLHLLHRTFISYVLKMIRYLYFKWKSHVCSSVRSVLKCPTPILHSFHTTRSPPPSFTP